MNTICILAALFLGEGDLRQTKGTLCLHDSSIHLRYGGQEKPVEQGNATTISIHLGSDWWNAGEQNFQSGILSAVKMSACSCF